MPKCLWVLVNFNLNATAALWNQSGPGRQIKWMSILQVEWWKEAKRPCLPLWTADVTAIEWGWMAFVTLSDVVIISVWMALESHLNIVLVVSCRDWPFRELSLCFYYLISLFFFFSFCRCCCCCCRSFLLVYLRFGNHQFNNGEY